MLSTPVCDRLGMQYPIVQGGMAWIATAELAGAVSNAGGLGVVAAGNAPPEWVQREIRRTRELTSRPFGLNIMLMSPFAAGVVETALAERVPVVFTGAGNPGPLIPRFKAAGIKVVPVVASVSLAKRLERSGADALVAEGMESGGHIGEITTTVLIPQIVDAVNIPVIAAGGFADGRGLVAALAYGAQAIQMGTRFAASVECIAHPNYKQRIVQARDRSTVATGHSLGHPVRALENSFTRRFAELEKSGCCREEIECYGMGSMRRGLIEGDVENGSLMAGQVAGMIREVLPVSTIIDSIIAEAELVLKRLAAQAGSAVHA
ncbi:MAG: enoyl-[acyl-carrier-protein] reductase FabK [Chloroflexi bacterium]|nr:enoyl-[acyl-carrier-protein] reductase FabK [Chloroflexota bacterium]MCL5108119.1 enoyl-[acyl-carrier-protein] reductase FabK [Chloroflexota bacterium]